jgi:hypothetical protein
VPVFGFNHLGHRRVRWRQGQGGIHRALRPSNPRHDAPAGYSVLLDGRNVRLLIGRTCVCPAW